MYRLRGCIAAGTRIPINEPNLIPDMLFPSRSKLIVLSVAAIFIAGCGPNSRLPEAPLEVEFNRPVEAPVPQNPVQEAEQPQSPAQVAQQLQTPVQEVELLETPVQGVELPESAARDVELPEDAGPDVELTQSPLGVDELPEDPAEEVVLVERQVQRQAPDTTLLEPPKVAIDVLHKADFNPFSTDNGKSFRALQTPEIYARELALHSIETPKPVNFATSQVLVSSLGEKTTGGYTVSVIDISESDNSIVVTVVQNIPGPACITTQGATYPFEFVVIPSRKPIEIFERQRIDDC